MKTTAGLQARLQLEAEILHSLWHDGAASVIRLEHRLGRSSSELMECLDDLIAKKYIYLHWPSPEGSLKSVYYLTTGLRRTIANMLKDVPRYRMKVFWELLCREEAGLPNHEILNVTSA